MFEHMIDPHQLEGQAGFILKSESFQACRLRALFPILTQNFSGGPLYYSLDDGRERYEITGEGSSFGFDNNGNFWCDCYHVKTKRCHSLSLASDASLNSEELPYQAIPDENMTRVFCFSSTFKLFTQNPHTMIFVAKGDNYSELLALHSP